MSDTKQKRVRKITHKMTNAEFLRKHSPIKNGLTIKDEDKPLEKYSKIMPRIYLGNYQAAKDADFFKEKNIGAVLNCTKDIPNHFQAKKTKSGDFIEYMRIPVDDSLKEVDFEKMLNFLPSASEFIHKHADLQKHNIFIHCYAGRQRSCCAVASYLMKFYSMSPQVACKYILDKRKEAFHYGLSLNFEDSLDKFAKQLKRK
jgi:protein-tyrosine phosphatase